MIWIVSKRIHGAAVQVPQVLQDRQLAKNIFFLANNFAESRHFSHDERSRVVTCRQLGRPTRQLIL